MNMPLEFELSLLASIMVACCECGAVRLTRTPSTYSTPGLQSHQMVDAGSVMISATRSVRPSVDPLNVGKGECSAAEAKVATLETQGRERDTEN